MSGRDTPDGPEDRSGRRDGGRRWGVHPWLSALIAVGWLLLQGSLAPAHLLWAAILGLGLPRLVHGFIGPPPRLKAGGAALRLLATVLWDIVVANLTVARIVLHPGITPQPAWVRVRYSLQDPRAVMLLASIITTTPGTVSCVVDEDRREILVHALNTRDAQALAQEILHRYERPLKEIFG